MLTIIPIPAFSDNYIWLMQAADSNKVCVVDPGEAKPVLDFLQRHHLQLEAILLTHHHHDHVGGVATLCQHFSVPVYGPGDIATVTKELQEDDQITLDFLGLELLIKEIPAHTLDHIAYIGDGLLFCGDTMFSSGCGRLFEGTAEQMVQSLAKLTALPNNTKVFCAHEYTQANLRFAQAVEPNNPMLATRIATVEKLRRDNQPSLPSSIELEKQTNPFLRCDQPEVIQSAETFAGKSLTNSTEVFAVLRHWKDGF